MMTKRTIAILLACSVLPLFCGCRRNAEADYQRGIECMQKEEHDEAVKAFEASINKAERVRDSHMQLAFYYERIGGHDLLALWHYEQAMKNTPKDAKEMPDIRAAVERNADAVLAHLQTVGRQEEQEALQLKVTLLEEHAMRQKKWIEELQRENTEYRKMLRDMK
ncbi:MAG: hypothetical protein IJU61_08750 [Victivallales bacterium]|nr:hypothetical protein [Victivallales bacterium]